LILCLIPPPIFAWIRAAASSPWQQEEVYLRWRVMSSPLSSSLSGFGHLPQDDYRRGRVMNPLLSSSPNQSAYDD
jgi:hypothetical protein